MKHESIKIGETTLDIANGSCGLDPDRIGDIATVAIIIGTNTMDNIHTVLSSSKTVSKYDIDGNKQWERDNLMYTGRISINPNFRIAPSIPKQLLNLCSLIALMQPKHVSITTANITSLIIGLPHARASNSIILSTSIFLTLSYILSR